MGAIGLRAILDVVRTRVTRVEPCQNDGKKQAAIFQLSTIHYPLLTTHYPLSTTHSPLPLQPASALQRCATER